MITSRISFLSDFKFALSDNESSIAKFLNSNLTIMNSLKNKVQLIGNLGNDPEIILMENGTKLAKFSLATNETYKNAKGEKVTDTQWHNIVAWGKLAEISEDFLSKGKEVMIEGKLMNRTYETNEGEKRYITEIKCNELLMLGK